MFYEEDTQVAQQAYGKTPTRLTVRLESLALDRRQEAVGVLVSGFPQRSGGRCLALVPVGPRSPSFHPCSTTALLPPQTDNQQAEEVQAPRCLLIPACCGSPGFQGPAGLLRVWD